MFNHDKYPIVVGAAYANDTDEIGILEYAELFVDRNDALIEINTNNCGRYYRLNYATFTMYWKLLQ